jgi:hypothetical protein
MQEKIQGLEKKLQFGNDENMDPRANISSTPIYTKSHESMEEIASDCKVNKLFLIYIDGSQSWSQSTPFLFLCVAQVLLQGRLLNVLNHGTQYELMQLTHIGPARASSVINARKDGKFGSNADLKRTGISQNVLRRFWKDNLLRLFSEDGTI